MGLDARVGPAARVVDADSLTVSDLFGARFPSPDLVSSAAALFDPAPLWRGDECARRYTLEVSPGVVALAVTDPARRERAGNKALGPFRAPYVDQLGRVHLPHPDRGRPLTEALMGTAAFLNVPHPEPGGGSPQREVTAFSRRSRARMVRRLAELDYRPLISQGTPAMLTLTYPGDWLTAAPDGRTVKRHLQALIKRWQRRWGSPLMGPWKLEIQARGAPHVHIWTVPPLPPRVAGRGVLAPHLEFAAWLSHTWADVVAHPDLEQRRRHVLAGTAVDYAEGSRYADPRRLAAYFSGHSLKHSDGKEYQHQLPPEWREAGSGPGRWWGYWHLERSVAGVAVTATQFHALRRSLRRLSRSRSRCAVVSVPRARVIVGTGEVVVSYRKVRRRVHHLSQSALVGGWLMSNDAPALVSALARHPVFRRE